MTTEPKKKYTLQEARKMRHLTRKELAKKADVSVSSIVRIEDGCSHQTKDEVAMKIADALGLDLNEIKWPRGLTAQGRPAGTGTTILRREIIMTVTETITIQSSKPLCISCFVELPVTLKCDSCE